MCPKRRPEDDPFLEYEKELEDFKKECDSMTSEYDLMMSVYQRMIDAFAAVGRAKNYQEFERRLKEFERLEKEFDRITGPDYDPWEDDADYECDEHDEDSGIPGPRTINITNNYISIKERREDREQKERASRESEYQSMWPLDRMNTGFPEYDSLMSLIYKIILDRLRR